MNDTFQENPVSEDDIPTEKRKRVVLQKPVSPGKYIPPVSEDDIPTDKMECVVFKKPVSSRKDISPMPDQQAAMQKPEQPEADAPPVSGQQAPAQKLEHIVQQRSRFSFLRGVSSLWQIKVRRRVPPVLQLTAVEC